ncbi:MAG: hypothetical protein WA865_04300 [Spirulinaceae cyanobacterium]
MEYWEFLLQQEGNRRWIPIKNAKVQLEEGKYRVVAHSSYVNCHVEVRVTYKSMDEVPPKRRSQKRSRQTNEEGLMVVIPFTTMKPGLWELSCSGDIVSDFFGESWQESVRFQILPQKVEEEVNISLLDTAFVEEEVERENQSTITSQQETVDTNLIAQTTHSEAEDFNPESYFNQADQETLDIDTNPIEEEVEIEAETYSLATPQAETVETNLTTQTTHSEAEDFNPESYFNQADQESLDTDLITQINNSVEAEFEAQSNLNQTNPENISAEIKDQETTSANSQVSLEEIAALETQNEESIQENQAIAEEIEDPFEIYLQEDTEATEVPQEETIYKLTPEEIAASERKELAAYDGEEETVSQTDITSTPTNQLLDQSVQNLEEMLKEVVEPLLQDLENPSEEFDFYPQIEEQEIFTSEILTEKEEEKLTLTLDREAFVRRQGESVVVSGRLDIPVKEQSEEGQNLFNGALRYRLRNPQTSEILFEVQQPLKEQRIPLAFSYPLDIPLECDSHLILGEVILEQQPEWHNRNESYEIISIQSFSIAADLSELLTAVSFSQVEEGMEEEEVTNNSYPPSLFSPQETSSINLDFLNFVNGSNNSQRPKLESPEIHVESSLNEEEISSIKRIEEIPKDEDLDANSVPETKEGEEGKEEEEGKEIDPSTDAFKSLKFQDRFLSRLNSLAIKNQPSESASETINLSDSKNNLPLVPNQKISQPKPTPERKPAPRYSPTNVAADLNSYEIVVDDDESLFETPPQLDTSGLPYPAELTQTQKETSLNSEAPVPTPVLTILDEELTANRPAIVRIKLPAYTGPIYVKLWIQDRQTRYIIESPRALVDFGTTRTGDLETLAQVVVPEGSMEVRLHAIAIDTETQCESRKATLDRVVIPPDLTEVSLEDF